MRPICAFLMAATFAAASDERGSKMQLTSNAFLAGTAIPQKYTEDGDDISPELEWGSVPEKTQELALICVDPDAPTPEPWVHWVLYKIPADVHSLPAGVPTEAQLKSPAGALQGLNSWKKGKTVGYRGPAPPRGHGVHHYHFRLYALDKPLNLPPKVDKQRLLEAMKGHILAEGELVGTYQR